jgi:hypothetical protein
MERTSPPPRFAGSSKVQVDEMGSPAAVATPFSDHVSSSIGAASSVAVAGASAVATTSADKTHGDEKEEEEEEEDGGGGGDDDNRPGSVRS